MREREEGSPVGDGPLLAKLAGFSLLPTLITAGALIGFFLIWREPGAPNDVPTLLIGCAVITAVGLFCQLVWLRRVARSLTDPVEELVRALDAGESPSASSRADWEIRLLYHRIDVLLRQQRTGRKSLEGFEAVRQSSDEVVECIDRIATDMPPGDAAACTGLLAPIGEALRALMERLDRRENELCVLFDQLGRSMTTLGQDVAASASGQESAFMMLLEAIGRTKEVRQSIDTIAREVDGVATASDLTAHLGRLKEMVRLLGTRLEESLEVMGQLSTRLEGDASKSRELVRRGRGLELEVDGVRRRVERGSEHRKSSNF
jgi:hypothetical protein